MWYGMLGRGQYSVFGQGQYGESVVVHEEQCSTVRRNTANSVAVVAAVQGNICPGVKDGSRHATRRRPHSTSRHT